MIVIENEFLKISINQMGGSLTSIFDKRINEELLYQKDERSWMGQDVVIFPVVGRLKKGSYVYDGNEYFMKNHGLIRYNKLDVIIHECDKVILGFKYNNDTLLVFPFKFYFEISYHLNNDSLEIEYRVVNLDNKVIYFNVGGHPGLKVNGLENSNGYVFNDVFLEFNKEYKVNKYILNKEGCFISHQEEFILPKSINISKELIEKEKTLIYDVLAIDEVILKSKDKEFIFDISKARFLAVWTNPGFGDFLCIEPWWGLPDYDDCSRDISNKKYITKLGKDLEYKTGYKIKFKE